VKLTVGCDTCAFIVSLFIPRIAPNNSDRALMKTQASKQIILFHLFRVVIIFLIYQRFCAVQPFSPSLRCCGNTMTKRKLTSHDKPQKRITSFFGTSSTSTTLSTGSSNRDPSSDETYRIYCDLDGVLVDFNAGVRQVCNGRNPDEISNVGIMWRAISQKECFYQNLPWMEDGRQLWDAISPLSPHILTGVPMSKKSRVDKVIWCKREFGVDVNHVDMAGPKKRHELVHGRWRDGVVNVITCWSTNKHFESAPKR